MKNFLKYQKVTFINIQRHLEIKENFLVVEKILSKKKVLYSLNYKICLLSFCLIDIIKIFINIKNYCCLITLICVECSNYLVNLML